MSSNIGQEGQTGKFSIEAKAKTGHHFGTRLGNQSRIGNVMKLNHTHFVRQCSIPSILTLTQKTKSRLTLSTLENACDSSLTMIIKAAFLWQFSKS